jgi:hypothetical protein
MPNIPAMPAMADGAGIGSLNKANKNPTIAPVNKENNMSFKPDHSF